MSPASSIVLPTTPMRNGRIRPQKKTTAPARHNPAPIRTALPNLPSPRSQNCFATPVKLGVPGVIDIVLVPLQDGLVVMHGRLEFGPASIESSLDLGLATLNGSLCGDEVRR